MYTAEQKKAYQKQYMANLRKNKDIAKSGQKQGLENASGLNMSNQNVLDPVRPVNVRPLLDPTDIRPVRPDNYGLDNCQCKHCQSGIINKNPKRLNHGDYMTASELEQNGFDLNRVTMPGDVDYISPVPSGKYGKCKYCGKDLSALSTAHLLECCYDCAISRHTPQTQEVTI